MENPGFKHASVAAVNHSELPKSVGKQSCTFVRLVHGARLNILTSTNACFLQVQTHIYLEHSSRDRLLPQRACDGALRTYTNLIFRRWRKLPQLRLSLCTTLQLFNLGQAM